MNGRSSGSRLRWGCGLALAMAACASSKPPTPAGADEATQDAGAARVAETSGTYAERRAQHQTKLTREGPITDKWPTEDAPAGAKKVTYRSGDLELWGWLAMPERGPRGAIVYLHGAFALDRKDFELVRKFLDNDYAVFTPSIRGRNGNPGSLELIYGEVDDAAAAVRFTAEQTGLKPEYVFAFGHSMGGATVALLAMRDDLGVGLTGSCGGIYSVDTFKRWSRSKGNRDLVRFDATDPDELELRAPQPHAGTMAHDHVAFVGDTESYILDNARALAQAAEGASAEFELVVIPGDHMSTLEPALDAFYDRIQPLSAPAM